MTPVALKPGAEQVKIVEFIPSENRAKYNEVDMVSCAIGGNMKGVQTNITSCENKLKNAAAEKGSNLVLVKPETKNVAVTSFNTGTQTATCENCVEMTGIVLKEKTVMK